MHHIPSQGIIYPASDASGPGIDPVSSRPEHGANARKLHCSTHCPGCLADMPWIIDLRAQKRSPSWHSVSQPCFPVSVISRAASHTKFARHSPSPFGSRFDSPLLIFDRRIAGAVRIRAFHRVRPTNYLARSLMIWISGRQLTCAPCVLGAPYIVEERTPEAQVDRSIPTTKHSERRPTDLATQRRERHCHDDDRAQQQHREHPMLSHQSQQCCECHQFSDCAGGRGSRLRELVQACSIDHSCGNGQSQRAAGRTDGADPRHDSPRRFLDHSGRMIS